jgi:hypothetical protein
MNKLKKIQHDCHKATFLIEKRTMARLTLREWAELNIHLAGCSVCRVYKKQSYLIGQMVHQLLYSNTREYKLGEKDKKVMEDRIEDALKK